MLHYLFAAVVRILTNLYHDLSIFLAQVVEQQNFIIYFLLSSRVFRKAVAVKISSCKGCPDPAKHSAGQLLGAYESDL